MIEFVMTNLLHLIDTIGYAGIVILMTIESSFIPFPSEIVIPPAGYLAAQGKMNIVYVIIAGTLGSLAGAYVNYYLARKFGEKIFLKIGKPFGLKQKDLDKAENFFNKHGAVGTFTGRLVPVVRQYISIPAGMAKMKHSKFIFYTSLGAGIWNIILAVLGYVLGNNESLIKQYSKKISILMMIVVAIIILGYIFINKKREKGEKNADF